MNLRGIAARAKALLAKPPSYVARRIWGEIDHTLAGFTQPAFGRNFRTGDLLRRCAARDTNELWTRLVGNSRRIFGSLPSRSDLEELAPGESARILEAAGRALRHQVDLLGSGPVALGETIDWHRDYKTGDTWPVEYFRRIDYINVERRSDVKTAWELSRMQWLLPCAQAWVLMCDERYPQHITRVLDQWMAANPYTCGVNWAVTMEPAMRLLTWTWMLRACADSEAFAQPEFRDRFTRTLFLHGLFVEKYFERSDVNGNHFTADAAALLVVGALFGEGDDVQRWLRVGQHDVEHEILLQVHPDGVDFEASTAYHRLVAELFLLSGLALRATGREPSAAFRQRLGAMAEFSAAYSRPDGFAPLWGDNDDARALPLGTQPLRDHRYLPGLIGSFLDDARLMALARGSSAEAAWWWGAEAARRLPAEGPPPGSRAFREGGVYILADARNHVFIDCGPIGLAGRGGHGHNDLMSFEATLLGAPLVTEGGCFVYTADNESRDIDRGTRSHNTPLVDGQEINRFLGPGFRWNMANDANHELVEFSAGSDASRFVGRHDGFARLTSPVTVERCIDLAHTSGTLRIHDRFIGAGEHRVEEPLHLASGVAWREVNAGQLLLTAPMGEFELNWNVEHWKLTVERGREAAGYGRMLPVERLVWICDGPLSEFSLSISPRGISS